MRRMLHAAADVERSGGNVSNLCASILAWYITLSSQPATLRRKSC